MYYTYSENRQCFYCGTPIPDQAHKGRLYCERKVLEDGSIENCKDDYWSAIRSEQNAEEKKPLSYHQKISNEISRLLQLNLPEYELEMLDSVGVKLHASLITEPIDKQNVAFYYIDYCIVVNFNNYKAIISKHDRDLF